MLLLLWIGTASADIAPARAPRGPDRDLVAPTGPPATVPWSLVAVGGAATVLGAGAALAIALRRRGT
jgi:hypothetical protein